MGVFNQLGRPFALTVSQNVRRTWQYTESLLSSCQQLITGENSEYMTLTHFHLHSPNTWGGGSSAKNLAIEASGLYLSMDTSTFPGTCTCLGQIHYLLSWQIFAIPSQVMSPQHLWGTIVFKKKFARYRGFLEWYNKWYNNRHNSLLHSNHV
jgi:hypothetical protein